MKPSPESIQDRFPVGTTLWLPVTVVRHLPIEPDTVHHRPLLLEVCYPYGPHTRLQPTAAELSIAHICFFSPR